jgi:hypothetical protein
MTHTLGQDVKKTFNFNQDAKVDSKPKPKTLHHKPKCLRLESCLAF